MNKERRKEIKRAEDLISEAKEILETCRDEEQEYHDNMPENFQSGEKGDAAQQCVDALESAVSNLDCVESDLGGIE